MRPLQIGELYLVGVKIEAMEEKITIEERILRNQICAVARVISLVGSEGAMEINEIYAALAMAEQEADFMCGFVLLNDDAATKERIVTEMVARGYAMSENNILKLTEEGKGFSQTPLPPQLEEVLSND